MAPSHWAAPPAELRLLDNEVHVWRAFLDAERASDHHSVLSEDERARASRFVFARDRHHFVAARGILRSIIGRYLQQPPVAIDFSYDSQGKPRLRTSGVRSPMRFNLSHSHGLAVYAFSTHRQLGIDVEAIRPEVTGEQIAERFFSTGELAELRSVPPEKRHEAFFLCWTRKEAYVKAKGGGLGIPLDSFDVSLTPGMRETLVSSDSGRWMLRSFHPAEQYAAAIVAEGRDWCLRLWNWQTSAP